jgi:phage FluMu gp28-like protein
MQWLDPWCSTEAFDERFRETFRKQLELEVPPGHCMYGLPVRLIARGNGDDALFEILDGSGRVADVHLTWSKCQERLPWPGAAIYQSLEEWVERVMLPEHKEWAGE